MRKFSLPVLGALLILHFSCGNKKQPRILVFTKTSGLSDSASGISQAILKACPKNGLSADTTTNNAMFNEDTLRKYTAVVFLDSLNSKYTLLDHYQKNAVTRYAEAGGGIYIVPENARSGGGYIGQMIADIKKSVGENNKLDYSKAYTLKTPPEYRFSKTALKVGQFYEPTVMTILPNLDILIAQRRGEILLYKHDDTTLEQVGYLHVYDQSVKKGVNAEEGLLGMKADPDFATNHFVYVFYSPIDTSVNRLSRFTFTNNKIDSSSEKIILQFYSQRNICCHTGGSIAFGKDHMLFLSAGDNSTPFNEPGEKYPSMAYAPLDERPGHEQYDARRSAGNTNDLRGKILRLKIKDDGTYEIPEGNLFPKGTPKTKPEIYIMGDRNPYRISFDPKNGFLYWGEVGPDANNDSVGRGPRGYDEFNQARSAGYFGWPLFVGNNYAYNEYNYATGKMGAAFDPVKPFNNSRNNTGLRQLPPAHPAFIWYPYLVSPDFPQLGSGSRCAMAGPVFYSSVYGNSGIPAYYNGKLFIYDLMRGWIRAVTMKPNGDFDHMEPFMQHTKINSPIDMEMGPDGHLYILDYGTGWFSQNADAGLYRIDYDSTATVADGKKYQRKNK